MKLIRIPRGINPHSHLRGIDDRERLNALLFLALHGGFKTLCPMPNLQPELTTAGAVNSYIGTLRNLLPRMNFIPIVMLTESTTKKMLAECVRYGIKDAKVYPKGRTTNSSNGVRDYAKLLSLVKYAGEIGMRIHFHPEYPNLSFDGRDAEYLFLPIIDMFMRQTNATLIWEHGTDARCIRHWKDWGASGRFFVTLTAHHLAESEDGAFGDVRSVCKPAIKTEGDRQGLVSLVKEGLPWVMAGLDDAPHPIENKHVQEGKCACGAYTAPFGLQLYAHMLDKMLETVEGQEKFVRFTSGVAQDLYKLPGTTETILLKKEPFKIPDSYSAGFWKIQPFWAGKTLAWSLSLA